MKLKCMRQLMKHRQVTVRYLVEPTYRLMKFKKIHLVDKYTTFAAGEY